MASRPKPPEDLKPVTASWGLEVIDGKIRVWAGGNLMLTGRITEETLDALLEVVGALDQTEGPFQSELFLEAAE